MDLTQLRDQACAHLALLLPGVDRDVSQMVDECFTDARKAFRDEFIVRLSPAAWARITLIYFKHFIDSGCDVSVAEIVVAVLRDSIHTSRMDMVTLQLVQNKLDDQSAVAHPPVLKVVSGEGDRR